MQQWKNYEQHHCLAQVQAETARECIRKGIEADPKQNCLFVGWLKELDKVKT